MTPATAAALLGMSLAAGVIAQYLFVREITGLNVVIATALAFGAAWRGRAVIWIARRDAWIPVGALVFAALCAIRVDTPLVAFDLVATVVLSLGTALVLSGVSVAELPLAPLLATGLDTLSGAAVDGARVLGIGWPALVANAPSRSSRGMAHAGGLALALPFVVLFGALFSSADAVFRHVVENAIDLTELRRLYLEAPLRLALAGVSAWLVAGWLSRAHTPPDHVANTRPRHLSAASAATMLVVLDLLFAAFVAIQIAYLFGGRDTLDAAGVAYSTYGRAGFFELVAAASAVAGLLFVLDLVVRDRGRTYALAALVLVALTTVVLASAWFRMDLYQQAYGWSELRLYAFVGIAYTAAVLAILAWSILRGTMELALQRMALAAAIVALAVNALGPSALVARHDLERVIDPTGLPSDASRELDVPYLISLGDGALPVIAELAPRLPEPDHSLVIEALRRASQQRAPARGWQSLNWDREVARVVVVRAVGEGTSFIR